MVYGLLISSQRSTHEIGKRCISFLWCRYKERRWDFKRVFGSGGMPSSHSSTVMGLTMAVAFQEGANSPIFAACLVLAAVVSLQASRHEQAGQQKDTRRRTLSVCTRVAPCCSWMSRAMVATSARCIRGKWLGTFHCAVQHFAHLLLGTFRSCTMHPESDCKQGDKQR